MEVAFLSKGNWTDDEGYHTIRVKARIGLTEAGTRDDLVCSPCFNRNTAPYYGTRDGGLDCVYWSHKGHDTEVRATVYGDTVQPEDGSKYALERNW